MQGLLNWLKSNLSSLLFVGGVGTFLAILGPYNTANLGWPWVWIYWVGLIALGANAGQLFAWVILRFKPDTPNWILYPLLAALVSVPVSAVVILIQGLVGPPTPLSYWPVIYFFVFVISCGVSTLTYMLEDRNQPETATGMSRALTDKLPVRLRTANLYALQSEDHYLRVHTSAGDALILMRLGDAIAAVETIEGAQTHRSWWVAKAAIEDASKSGGRAELKLAGDLTAPVSRTYYPKLKEMGWI